MRLRKHTAGVGAIDRDLSLERIDAVELLLRPQISEQLDGDELAVKIAVEVEQMNFHERRFQSKCRANAETCGAAVGAAVVQVHAHGVNAECRQERVIE